MKINKIEEEIDVLVLRNDDFTYDLILGLDAIKKFKLRWKLKGVSWISML